MASPPVTRKRKTPKGNSSKRLRVRGVMAAPDDAESGTRSEMAKRRILDATIACFAEFGWEGANASQIARRMGMTRGRLQYYFPTLEDIRSNAVEHLYAEWQKKYWESVSQVKSTQRFSAGIELLWDLMNDKLHAARQVLEANARTNPQLRTLLERLIANDEELMLRYGADTFPSLAQHPAAFRAIRTFVIVFMEGLSQYRLPGNREEARKTQLDLLKVFVLSYWRSLGVKSLPKAPTIQLGSLKSAFGEAGESEVLEKITGHLKEALILLGKQRA